MTTVFRAYSPTRDKGTTVSDDRYYAAWVAGTRNQQAAVHPDQPDDWYVQTGTVEWETP